LIGIARVGHLSILQGIYSSVTIPPRVFEELNTSSNKPGAKVLSEAISASWLQIVELKKPIDSAILRLLIDAGESESIQLALEQNARLLIIDDKKGRKAAKSRGIHVIGTGGILISAKKAGLLNEISQVLNNLAGAGYRLSPDLCNRILELANER
jgi:predicted nucleic acid-binding protein